MSLPYAAYNFVCSPGLCYCGGTLMCPTAFVVLPSLKVGSRDGTSFSIVCTMCPKTSGPPPNFNVYTEAANDLQRHCCSLLWCKRTSPAACVYIEAGGAGVGSFLRTLVLGRLLHNFQL